jgi:adhesin transport system outer membrane protein
MVKIKYLLIGTMLVNVLHATSLRDSIEDAFNNNPSIIAEHINRDAYLKYIDQEQGDYLPTIDLDAFVEKSKTYNNPDTPPPAQGWSEKDGWNVALKVSHILYDGGLTPAEVEEFVQEYNANKYSSIANVEDTIYETIQAYVDLVSTQELMALAQNNIDIHEEYLQIAKEKEEISGEVLETHQVSSKRHDILDSFLEQENEKLAALSLYKKLVGEELDGNVCRPIVDDTFVPATLKEAVELGLRRSFKIKEQIAKVNKQREKIAQEKAAYLPTITAEFQASADDDLELEENGRQEIYRGRVYLSWNLFNGGKTYHATQKEILFLKEEQKRLDEITEEVIDEVTNAYNSYFNKKKRVENLTKYVEDNLNILKVYKKQLADGTRTFIDILNAESELYRSDIDKIDQEFEQILTYYDLMNKMSMLSDVVLMQDKQVCEEYTFVPRDRGIQQVDEPQIGDDLKDLFLEEGALETNNETIQPEAFEQEAQEVIAQPKEDPILIESPIEEEKNIDERLDNIYGLSQTEIEMMSLNSKPMNNNIEKYKYTINLATVESKHEFEQFLKHYSLSKKYINTYRFGKNDSLIKLLFGKFASYEDAKEIFDSFDDSLKKYIYIDNLSKHTKLKEKSI